MSATRSKLSVMLGLKLDISRFRSGPYKSRVRSFALNFITADLKFTRSHLLLCLLSFFDKAIIFYNVFGFYNNWRNRLKADYLTADINKKQKTKI